ncbi:hypothetical protein KEM54_002849 [Ascosphaera aggregata]|nr:hypothetical protein KEM54_002849 [Ascosphaera aggregata]
MGLPQTRTEAAEALKKYGQQRYIDGDYEGALAAFNEGYLRTAIVLRFMKKPDKARDILRYALRTLPMDSTFYKDVVRAEKNVSAALHGPQTFDPSSVLPFEVMRMIMLQLSIQDRILAPKRKPLSAKSILTFLKLSNCSPVQATLTRLPPMEARKALEYLSRCDSLQELGLDCPSDQWHEIFTPTKFRNLRSLNVCSDAPVTPTNMRRLCYSLPQLEHLQFWAIDDNFGGTQDAFPAVMPHLRSLTINGWKASEPVAALCKVCSKAVRFTGATVAHNNLA